MHANTVPGRCPGGNPGIVEICILCEKPIGVTERRHAQRFGGTHHEVHAFCGRWLDTLRLRPSGPPAMVRSESSPDSVGSQGQLECSDDCDNSGDEAEGHSDDESFSTADEEACVIGRLGQALIPDLGSSNSRERSNNANEQRITGEQGVLGPSATDK